MQPADPIWVRETLVGDAVKGAADAGRVPNRQGAEDYIVEVLRKMDRKKSEARPPKGQVITNPADKKAIYEEEFEKRTGRKLTDMTIERDVEERGRLVKEEDLQKGLLGSIIERFKVIKHHPEMYQKVKILVLCLNSPKRAKRLQAANKLYALMDKTDAVVGYSWRKPKPEKLIFGA
jgi:hypothetical protein